VGAALLGGAVALSLTAHASSPLNAVSAVGRVPAALAVDPRSSHVFVANSNDDTVTMLDARTGRVLQTTAVGGDPDQLQINPRTERVFVLNQIDGSVSVLDALTGALRRTLTLGVGPGRAVDHQTPDVFVFGSVSGVGGTSPIAGLDGTDLVAVLDAPSGSRLQSIASSLPALGLAVDGLTERLFVPDTAADRVDMFDAVQGWYLRSIDVGTNPLAIALDPHTRRAFVASMGPVPPAPPASSVSVLDSASGRVLRTVAVGHYPGLVAVDVAGGRVLVVRRDPLATGPGVGEEGTDVLDARSGRLLARLPAGAVAPEYLGAQASQVTVDERRGHVFILEQGGSEHAAGRMLVLDDRKARVLRSMAVAAFAIALAVDAPADRLYVLHSYSDCRTPSTAWAALPASVRRWLPFLPPAPAPGQAQPACADQGSVSVFDLARL
jgi:YVTN family beta-propeller protein